MEGNRVGKGLSAPVRAGPSLAIFLTGLSWTGFPRRPVLPLEAEGERSGALEPGTVMTSQDEVGDYGY